MGILSSGFRAKLFLPLWWSLRSGLLSFPPNACRGERCGSGGASPPRDWVLVFSSGAFPLRLPGALFFSSGNLLSACAPVRDRRLHYDLFGSGRGTSTLNLQIEFFDRAQRRCRGCAVPKGFPAWAKKFLFSVKAPPSMSLSVELYFLQQAKFLSLDSPGGDSPEVDGQLTGQSNDGFLAGSGTGFAIGQQRSPAA